MALRSQRFRACLFVFGSIASLYLPTTSGWERLSPEKSAATSLVELKRPVTVRDTIQMEQFGAPSYIGGGDSAGIVAQFSPDGKRFVIILRRGNLERNTNDYSATLWKTSDVFLSPVPQVLFTLSSSSNRPAIQMVKWLADDDTITFLGEHPGELQQLYTFNCSSGRMRRITNHSTSLVSYAISGGSIVYSAEAPPNPYLTGDAKRNGITVTTQRLPDLLSGVGGGGNRLNDQVFAKQGAFGAYHHVLIDGAPLPMEEEVSLSPSGRYLAVATKIAVMPTDWDKYDYHSGFLQHVLPYRYTIVDLTSGVSQTLLDAPVTFESRIRWSSDSRSVILTGVYLPLATDNPAERSDRKSKRFAIEVTVPGLKTIPILEGDNRLSWWNARTNEIHLQPKASGGIQEDGSSFRKSANKWEQLPSVGDEIRPKLEIALEENSNSPPRILARDKFSGKTAILLDLNPDFSQLAFGKVQEIKWKATDGREVQGGLYYPPDYSAREKYPLVIQTHGFNPHKFWINGPWATAFAAQPLAGRGFVVLQVREGYESLDTAKEGPRVMAAYEGAIDYLDQMGLIDRNEVGIIGFSRTCFYVKYCLTHSKYHFAAAVVADGIDAGYFQYIAFANSVPEQATSFDAINGGEPFGEGLGGWLRSSPGFRMDGVDTPLLVQAIGRAGLLSEWEWFSGLRRLNKPVDLVYLPEGDHVLEKPWERLTSEQEDVEWFLFWLKGEQEAGASMVQQYVRWTSLRESSKAAK